MQFQSDSNVTALLKRSPVQSASQVGSEKAWLPNAVSPDPISTDRERPL